MFPAESHLTLLKRQKYPLKIFRVDPDPMILNLQNQPCFAVDEDPKLDIISRVGKLDRIGQ